MHALHRVGFTRGWLGRAYADFRFFFIFAGNGWVVARGVFGSVVGMWR